MALLFLLWLCASAVMDAKYRKCYNWLVLLGIVAAFISVTLIPKAHPVNISPLDSIIGAFLAFLVLLIFYIKKMMGAGDIKFSAALGAWIGWELLLPIWALSCGFAVIHGFFVRSNAKYFFYPAMKWEDGLQEKGKRFIPYVTYLSIATVIVLMLNKY